MSDARGDRAAKSGSSKHFGDLAGALRPVAIRLTKADAIAFGVMNHAGLSNVRGKINERAKNAARFNGRRDNAPRIHTFQVEPIQLTAMILEIPPRNAVLRADHHCVGTE